MAFGEILIHKIYEENQTGYYQISSDYFDMNDFYMSVDKSKKIIKFFLKRDFTENPIRIIDYNKNERMGCIPGIPTKVFGIVLMRAFKVFKMGTFPDSLSYAA